MMTKSQKAAQAKYEGKITRVTIKLNPDTDADIIQILEAQDNKQKYIKECLRRMT